MTQTTSANFNETARANILAEWERLGGRAYRDDGRLVAVLPDGHEDGTGGWGIEGLLTHCQTVLAQREGRMARQPAHNWAEYVEIEGEVRA